MHAPQFGLLLGREFRLPTADALIARHDDLATLAATGKASIRAHLLKVVQEYARHNGHADIIRERIDGSRGE